MDPNVVADGTFPFPNHSVRGHRVDRRDRDVSEAPADLQQAAYQLWAFVSLACLIRTNRAEHRRKQQEEKTEHLTKLSGTGMFSYLQDVTRRDCYGNCLRV
jgi:hypothetical protein